jgi:nickel-dependent lactate racemase
MTYLEYKSFDEPISTEVLKSLLYELFQKLGERKKVLAIPPDATRLHSRAGEITTIADAFYGDRLSCILPALGTHTSMNARELANMFPGVSSSKFKVHNWRTDVVTLGTVPSNYLSEVSEGKISYSWPAQVNKLLVNGGFDLILSVGQVVPHEVIGMANYNKNIFIGTGGEEGINKSHFLGAVYGMERIMGRAINPVRKVLNYASDHFATNLPIVYILTVVGKDSKGNLALYGLFAGDDSDCFIKASEMSLKVNFALMNEPVKKFIVYLDPQEYKSTWLGNKSIYRTRMAIADKGDLIILAPGIKQFGEDPEIDRLIRKYGYRNSSEVLNFVNKNEEMKKNLSAAAHLIHGSSEGRFNITYSPGALTKQEIESVGYHFADLRDMLALYDPAILKDGINRVNGEDVYYISNPALGLWAHKDRFKE